MNNITLKVIGLNPRQFADLEEFASTMDLPDGAVTFMMENPPTPNKGRRKKRNYLTDALKQEALRLYENGFTGQVIGERLDFHPSTICRYIKSVYGKDGEKGKKKS